MGASNDQTTETAPNPVADDGAALRWFLTPVFPTAGAPIEITGRRVVVGRAPPRGGVTIADARASRGHLELKPAALGGGVRVRDLGSKNGTLLDGQRVEREYLDDGAILRAGDTLLTVTCARLPSGFAPLFAPGVALHRSVAEVLADRAGALTWPGTGRLTSVLVRGPTGAGKERLAERIHAASGRAGAFVPVNCGSLNRELLGSELFGHVRGAFSGARADRGGLFAAAHAGTLFLDEVAELPLDQQPALLRALQEGMIRPVGADRELPVDVRVVAATHRPLERLCAEGAFRDDLHARLAGFVVELPGLTRRRADILPLFEAFLGGRVPLTADAAEALLVHDWPHNVRGLQHAATQVRAFAGAVEVIDVGLLPSNVQRSVRSRCAVDERAVDAEVLEAGLRRHRGNVTSLARELGHSRQQVYRRLEAFGLDPEAYR